VRNNGTYVLPPDAFTLAEAMQTGGRTTAAFVSAFVLDRKFGTAQGFDTFDDEQETRANAFTIETRDADRTVNAALKWLATRAPDEKLFVWLHFFDPHAPYKVRSDAPFGHEIVDRYDTEIKFMDAEIGRFRDAVASHGRKPVWILIADHGEGLMQTHGDTLEASHGVFLYEQTMRIPFILHGEGVIPVGVSRTRARQSDVLPTVLELAGLDVPPGLDGRSLLGAQQVELRDVYLESLLPFENYGWSPLHGLIRGTWKYIDSPLPELYDLAADPDESINLYREYEDRAEAMRLALEELTAREGRESVRLHLDGASVEKLRALGYLAGGGIGDETDDLPDPKLMMKSDFNIQLTLDEVGTLFAVGQPTRAVDRLLKIVEMNPANLEAMMLLGWEPLRVASASRSGSKSHPQEAGLLRASRIGFDLLVEHAPELPDGEFGIGQLLRLEGDLDGAIEHYEKVLAEHPGYQKALEVMMLSHGSRREMDQFVTYAERLIEENSTHFQANFQLGNYHKFNGDCAAAIERYEAIENGPGDLSSLYLWMADCHRDLGDCPKALEYYARVTYQPLRERYEVDGLEAACREGSSR
jgi:tetratricopeptide (TPR) repeat protein